MFAYCGNNPANYTDLSGNAFEIAFDVFTLGLGIGDVANNPDDLLAWLGLIGDIIDVAVPFVSGVGEFTRGVRIASEIVDTADDVHDAIIVVDDSSDTLTTLYRSVSNAEAEDILATGQFNLPLGGMESKQFGLDLDETRQFGQWVGQEQIVSASIPTSMLGQFYRGGVDTSIFRSGTLTVYGDQLDIFNKAVKGTITFIP